MVQRAVEAEEKKINKTAETKKKKIEDTERKMEEERRQREKLLNCKVPEEGRRLTKTAEFRANTVKKTQFLPPFITYLNNLFSFLHASYFSTYSDPLLLLFLFRRIRLLSVMVSIDTTEYRSQRDGETKGRGSVGKKEEE